jgi:hypothetical protein
LSALSGVDFDGRPLNPKFVDPVEDLHTKPSKGGFKKKKYTSNTDDGKPFKKGFKKDGGKPFKKDGKKPFAKDGKKSKHGVKRA